MKTFLVIFLAFLIAVSGGLLVYGAILGPAKTYVPEKDGLLAAPPADIYSEGKPPYAVSSFLKKDATSDEIAEAIANVCYNALQVKRYYFVCRVDSLAGNKYFCSDYFRILQEGTDFFYQALTYAAGTNTGVRHACVGSTRLDVTTLNVTYNRSEKTFDAVFPDPTKREGDGKPYNYYPDRAEVLFNLPLALADESGRNADFSVMKDCSFTITAPSSAAPYYTLELSLSADSVNASSETVRCLNDGAGGKMKNIKVSALDFTFTIWQSGVFRSIDVSADFSATVSGKTANANMKRKYEFSYTPNACSIVRQIEKVGWEKFCDSTSLNEISAREAAWVAEK